MENKDPHFHKVSKKCTSSQEFNYSATLATCSYAEHSRVHSYSSLLLYSSTVSSETLQISGYRLYLLLLTELKPPAFFRAALVEGARLYALMCLQALVLSISFSPSILLSLYLSSQLPTFRSTFTFRFETSPCPSLPRLVMHHWVMRVSARAAILGSISF